MRTMCACTVAIVQAVAEGAEIAARLYMSLATVKDHVFSILTNLDMDNRTQIALLAHDAELWSEWDKLFAVCWRAYAPTTRPAPDPARPNTPEPTRCPCGHPEDRQGPRSDIRLL